VRDVAIAGYAASVSTDPYAGNEIELVMPVVADAVAASGLARDEIGITVAASSDFLVGQAFAFVRGLDAVGAYPVIDDSHLDMDGAWALYEAWVRLQVGDVDSALVYAIGKTSAGRLHELMPLSYDPYYVAPLSPDPRALAALQARCLIDAGVASERDFADVAARVHGADALELLRAPYVASPLRAHDCPPVTDGAAAVVLVAGDAARRAPGRAVWIRGIDHRVEPHALGARDLTRAPSVERAAHEAGAGDVSIAELHTQYAHEEIVLRRALGLDDHVAINPSGGPLRANPVMATGLIRIGEAAASIAAARADRAVAHAGAGACLQQNLVCVLEGA
jgi:acetyl-CoA acetyltransferase